jgi:hypothetical protein
LGEFLSVDGGILGCDSGPILTLFPTGPAKDLPYPSGSHISNRFLARGLLIALIMKTASTSEASVNFYQAARRNNPEDNHCHFQREAEENHRH